MTWGSDDEPPFNDDLEWGLLMFVFIFVFIVLPIWSSMQ